LDKTWPRKEKKIKQVDFPFHLPTLGALNADKGQETIQEPCERVKHDKSGSDNVIHGESTLDKVRGGEPGPDKATRDEPVTGTVSKDKLSPKNSANPISEALQKTYNDGEYLQPNTHAPDNHPKPRSIEEVKASIDKAMKCLNLLISAKAIEIPKEVKDVNPTKVTNIEHTANTIQWAINQLLSKLKVKSEKQKPIRDILVKWF